MTTILRSSGLRCGVLAVLLTGSLLVAQEKSESKPAAKPAAAPKAQVRLPDNFAKLSLADDQKKKIYGIRATYSEQISQLEAQLKALREKEMAEVETVLTPDQLKLLTGIRAETKKKLDDARAAAKAAAEKKAESEKKAEPAKKAEPEKKPATTEKKP